MHLCVTNALVVRRALLDLHASFNTVRPIPQVNNTAGVGNMNDWDYIAYAWPQPQTSCPFSFNGMQSCQNQTSFPCIMQFYNANYALDAAQFMRYLGAPLGLNIATDVRGWVLSLTISFGID